jgi:hypothetical protein
MTNTNVKNLIKSLTQRTEETQKSFDSAPECLKDYYEGRLQAFNHSLEMIKIYFGGL